MATKIIKAWINGAIQEIEVEDIVSPEQPLSPEERLDVLEDKHEVVITDGNFLIGNGTEELEEITPEEVLSHINGASVMTMTTAEYESISEDETNANTLYMLTDSEDIDATLTQSGVAADAKAVGDALASIEYTNAEDNGDGIVILSKSVQAVSGDGASIDDTAISISSTWSSQKLFEKMCTTTTDIGATVEINPMHGTAIGDIVTWIKSTPVNVVADKAWTDIANWEICGEENNYTLIYKFKMDAGYFDIKGYCPMNPDIGEVYLCEIDSGDEIATSEVFVPLPYDENFEITNCYFPDRFGNHTAAIVVTSCCALQYIDSLEIWHTADLGEYVYADEITLTVTNGGKAETYNQTSGWMDFGAGMGYNWTTGQVLCPDGSILTDTDPGTPIEIIAESDVVSFEVGKGMVEVAYKVYPTTAIENLQKEITALKEENEKLTNAIVALGGNI